MSIILTRAEVEHINPLTDSIIELVLAPEHYVDYQPGQYLQIRSGDEYLSYSIANAPLGSHKYELHIRHDHSNRASQALFAEIKSKGVVNIRLPMGDCHLNRLDSDIPVLFIAGGTGFAPIKAMIEQMLADGDQRLFELYWGARSQSDLYMDDKVRQWAAHVEHFCYFSLLPTHDSKETLANMVIAQHKKNIANYQIVIGGPFDMVFATRDALLDAGASASRLYSDAFSFVPPLAGSRD